MRNQAEKAAAFRALHQRPGCFLIPNPWDGGTAKILAALGYEALATTSLGVANMLGRSGVTRAEVLANAREIVEATDLPVNADLENCFAHEPAAAAETIRRVCRIDEADIPVTPVADAGERARVEARLAAMLKDELEPAALARVTGIVAAALQD